MSRNAGPALHRWMSLPEQAEINDVELGQDAVDDSPKYRLIVRVRIGDCKRHAEAGIISSTFNPVVVRVPFMRRLLVPPAPASLPRIHRVVAGGLELGELAVNESGSQIFWYLLMIVSTRRITLSANVPLSMAPSFLGPTIYPQIGIRKKSPEPSLYSRSPRTSAQVPRPAADGSRRLHPARESGISKVSPCPLIGCIRTVPGNRPMTAPERSENRRVSAGTKFTPRTQPEFRIMAFECKVPHSGKFVLNLLTGD